MCAGSLIVRLNFEARYSRARKLFWTAGSRFRDQDFFKRGGPFACGDGAATRPREVRPHYIGGHSTQRTTSSKMSAQQGRL